MQTALPIAAPPAPAEKSVKPMPVQWLPDRSDFKPWQGPTSLAVVPKSHYIFHDQEAWGDRSRHCFRVLRREVNDDSWRTGRQDFTAEERTALLAFMNQQRGWGPIEAWGPGYFIVTQYTSIGD